MEFVINEPESDWRIYIEQIDHGKFARLSSTSLLLNVSALGPALRVRKSGNWVSDKLDSTRSLPLGRQYNSPVLNARIQRIASTC
jgi:hypothetical protein